MKIKVTKKSYAEVQQLPKREHKNPVRQTAFWRAILNLASRGELKQVHFHAEKIGMDRLEDKEPCLFLMNHSSFTDLQMAASLLKDRQYHIVCTNDGFIGKEGLMRRIGCIPTCKFIMDLDLIKDMRYAIDRLGSSILMYPEASYTFDGTQTPLPGSLGKCLKLLKVPVVMIMTDGAFLRDPLYNGLQKRKVKATATMKYLLSPEEIAAKTPKELNEILEKEFTYDHFRRQKEEMVQIDEPFRADGLHRVLYQCPACRTEGRMEGKGIHITCHQCGKTYELKSDGTLQAKLKSDEPLPSQLKSDESLPSQLKSDGILQSQLKSEGILQAKLKSDEILQSQLKSEGILQAKSGETEFTYVSDWYRWERENVRREIEAGRDTTKRNGYKMEFDCRILVLADLKSMYDIGEGHFIHTVNGFELKSRDGSLLYRQKPSDSYSLYADYFWYEIGDMISIGNTRYQYYCFPLEAETTIVAKARLAAEEMYKMPGKKNFK